jgi:3-hydroxymyristoyl/3-hydroxydecanoyl-(acyl carrier protein) dehydratase
MTRLDAAPRYPTVLSRDAGPDRLDLSLRLPNELIWFDGHFPGEPILAAVVQVDWVVHYGTELGFNIEGFEGMPRLKFKVIITPDTELSLSLVRKDVHLNFVYTSPSVVHSEGTIEFSS